MTENKINNLIESIKANKFAFGYALLMLLMLAYTFVITYYIVHASFTEVPTNVTNMT